MNLSSVETMNYEQKAMYYGNKNKPNLVRRSFNEGGSFSEVGSLSEGGFEVQRLLNIYLTFPWISQKFI